MDRDGKNRFESEEEIENELKYSYTIWCPLTAGKDFKGVRSS
jgi:peptide subunit release factor RF-3